MNTTPKKIDQDARTLVEGLGLKEDSVMIMNLRNQTGFDAVEQYCTINCIKKQELDGGSL